MDALIALLGLSFLAMLGAGVFFVLRETKENKNSQTQTVALTEQIHQSIAASEEKLKKCGLELDGIRQENAELRQIGQELERTKEEARASLEAVVNFSRENNELQEKFASAQQEIQRQRTFQEGQQAELERLRKFKEENDALRKELKATEAWHQESEALKQELLGVRVSKDVEQELLESKAAVMELEKEMIELRLERDELGENLEKFQASKERLEKELTEAREVKKKQSRLEKDLASVQEKNKAEVNQLEQELEILKAKPADVPPKDSSSEAFSAVSAGEIEELNKKLHEQLKGLEKMLAGQEEEMKKRVQGKGAGDSDAVIAETWLRRFLLGRDPQRIWISKDEFDLFFEEMKQKNDLIKKLIAQKNGAHPG